jgi:hypothetical protein
LREALKRTPRGDFDQNDIRFHRTTILGGVLFLTPLVALALILNKAYI